MFFKKIVEKINFLCNIFYKMLRIAVIVMAVLNSLLFISFMSLSLQIDAFGFAFKFSYAIRECLSGRFPGTE